MPASGLWRFLKGIEESIFNNFACYSPSANRLLPARYALGPRLASAPNDAERLRTLRYHDMLHTLREAVFDEFVALTTRIFSLPISLISPVDEDEVYYPANHGLPGQAQQPRVEALCSLVVQQNKAVVLTHLTQNEALRLTAAADAAARAKGLRFYAGPHCGCPTSAASLRR